ncbi:ABC transporter permease [Streptomyces sp. NPDC048416]|uniref:ABC transporter permease n=1 Tax=Streptomyces sp. NPDC048416 TaxID=3365546 RepID=UPI003716A8AB
MSTTTGTATEKITAPDSVSAAESVSVPGPGPAPSSVTSAASVPHDASQSGVRRVPSAAARLRWAVRRLPHLLLRGATKSVAIVALLLLWETAPRLGLVDRIFLPPFSGVARAWWELASGGQLADNARASLVRSFSGFGLAVAVAVPLGLLIGWYRPVADILGPLLEVFRNTAALALLPVFVLLLGIGETSKISIVVYACTWPILLNTISAVRNVDPTLLKLAKSMNLSAPRLFQKVILPSSVPVMFTGIRLAGSVSILVLVAAEMIGAKAGLGYLINASQYNFAIPQMYAGIITISAIGVAFNQFLVAVERRLSSWRVPVGG